MRLSGSKCISGQTAYLHASVSIEAALALPVFIMFIVAFSMLIQVFRSHELVHSSLVNAANSMAIQNYAIADMKKVYRRNAGVTTNRLRFSDNESVDMNEFYYNMEKYNDYVLKDSFYIYQKYSPFINFRNSILHLILHPSLH